MCTCLLTKRCSFYIVFHLHNGIFHALNIADELNQCLRRRGQRKREEGEEMKGGRQGGSQVLDAQILSHYTIQGIKCHRQRIMYCFSRFYIIFSCNIPFVVLPYSCFSNPQVHMGITRHCWMYIHLDRQQTDGKLGYTYYTHLSSLIHVSLNIST